MQAVNIIVPPTVEPVTLDEMKAQVRRPSSYTSEDGALSGYIAAARSVLERRMGWAFHEQTLRCTLDCWPNGPISLPRATPLLEVLSVKYTDFTGIVTTWDPANYIVDKELMPGRLAPKGNAYYPITILSTIAGIEINYRAGIPDAASPAVRLPARIRQAILMLAGHFYQNRETVSIGTLMQGMEMPWSVEALIFDDCVKEF